MLTQRLAIAAAAVSLALLTPALAAPDGSACRDTGVWIDGRDGAPLPRDALFADLAGETFVLLGETHDNAEHHRWQLHTLAALHGRSDSMVIGFEMFPRRQQPVLDRWVRGELSDKEFLDAVDWRRSWGYDAALYMPLFEFARMHGIPMVALNVDRELVSRVGAEGWDAVPADEKEGIGRPAQASADYVKVLAEIYRAHDRSPGTAEADQSAEPADATDVEDILERPAFKRFVEAQLTWDRAMAEGLADAKRGNADALIVGVMGSGHLSFFHGVPHQLEDLGFDGGAVLIPAETEQACDAVGSNYATALFTVTSRVDPDAEADRPLLGVMLRDAPEAALIDRVMPDSVAQSAGLRDGDRIVRAAGVDIDDAAALVAVIARQAPGTWLPLTVERSGSTIDLLAKFPAAADPDS